MSDSDQSWFRQGSKLFMVSICFLLIGSLGVILIQRYVDHAVESVIGGNMTAVVVAKNRIDQGDRIELDDLEVKKIPSQYAHLRSVPADQQHLLSNQMSAIRLEKGEVLLWDSVDFEDAGNLSDYLGVTERAITIRVDEINSVNNMIEPGDRIDIMTVTRSGTFKDNSVLRDLLQNIYVLAVDNRVLRGEKVKASEEMKISTLTVKVMPNEAALLAYAQSQGKLVVSLRNKNDVFVTEIPQVTESDLKPTPAAYVDATLDNKQAPEVMHEGVAAAALNNGKKSRFGHKKTP